MTDASPNAEATRARPEASCKVQYNNTVCSEHCISAGRDQWARANNSKYADPSPVFLAWQQKRNNLTCPHSSPVKGDKFPNVCTESTTDTDSVKNPENKRKLPRPWVCLLPDDWPPSMCPPFVPQNPPSAFPLPNALVRGYGVCTVDTGTVGVRFVQCLVTIKGKE